MIITTANCPSCGGPINFKIGSSIVVICEFCGSAIARTDRERSIALANVARDQTLVASAGRVAALSLTAYREGAAPLATAIEAQRNSREILAQYIDHLAAAWIATAALRVRTLTVESSP